MAGVTILLFLGMLCLALVSSLAACVVAFYAAMLVTTWRFLLALVRRH